MVAAVWALVPFLLAHVAQAARLINSSFHAYTNPWIGVRKALPKCKALEALGKLNWAKFAGKEWMEMMNYPDAAGGCKSWIFFPANRTVVMRTRSDICSKKFRDVASKFEPDEIQRGPSRRGDQFRQILDTDNHSWTLMHECQPTGFGSRFSILAPKSTSPASARMAEKADRYMGASAYGKRARWVRSRCQRRRNKCAHTSDAVASSLILV
ncbi:uncharacterized protein [Dermacentor andersoni]|uniref:uncharacterized protein n=1 Tax=Dermacentor andersoni TaxID=34620 RepID=UPI002155274C|nr:uncharacterized protein LOC126542517 [Dermacentor andersoni]